MLPSVTDVDVFKAINRLAISIVGFGWLKASLSRSQRPSPIQRRADHRKRRKGRCKCNRLLQDMTGHVQSAAMIS